MMRKKRKESKRRSVVMKNPRIDRIQNLHFGSLSRSLFFSSK